MPGTQTDVFVCLHNVRISCMIIKLTSHVGLVGGNLPSVPPALDGRPLARHKFFYSDSLITLLSNHTRHIAQQLCMHICVYVGYRVAIKG